MRELVHYSLAVILSILLALGIGIGSAWWVMSRVPGSFRNGPWRHDPLTGSVAAGPYARAMVAKHLPLALSNSEAIYLVAETDSSGNKLRCKDTYRIEGRDIEARWWSITCYGVDDFLVPNRQDRYSYNMANLTRNADGTYTISVGQSERAGNWLPTGDGDNFRLVLRIYNPTPTVRDRLGTIHLPEIVREDGSHE